MSKKIKIKATPRETGGSGKARRVLRSGYIPAALNRLSSANDAIQLDQHNFYMATRGLSSDQAVLQLELDGSQVTVLMREIQRNVLTGDPIHVDFSELDMNQPMRVACAIRLLGEPAGVRNDGGILNQSLHEVLVECLPNNYVESFTLNVSDLNVGESITVADLDLGDGITLMTAEDIVVASVIAPRVGGDDSAGEESDEAAEGAKDGEAESTEGAE